MFVCVCLFVCVGVGVCVCAHTFISCNTISGFLLIGDPPLPPSSDSSQIRQVK